MRITDQTGVCVRVCARVREIQILELIENNTPRRAALYLL